MPRHKVLGLQLLRALAAMLVVYAHLIERVVLRGFADPAAWWLNIEIGHFGVCIFFAISGFVMIHANHGTFGRAGYRDHAAVFFKRRLARIYPLYALATLVFVGFAWGTKHDLISAVELIKSLLFIPYMDKTGVYEPVYMLGWSLNYEMLFYLVVGLALVLPMRWAVAAICATILALVACGRMLGDDPFHHSGGDIAWYFTRPVMLYFVAGVLARGIPLQAFERGLVTALAAAVGLLALALAYRTEAAAWYSALFMFVFIRALALHVSYDGLWPPGRRAVEFLGDSSYSLYLTHSFVLGGITIAVARLVHAPGPAIAASLVLGFAATVAVAGLVYVAVERPLVRRATRWLLQ